MIATGAEWDEVFDDAPNPRADEVIQWGTDLTRCESIADDLFVHWTEGWDGFEPLDDERLVILLDRRLFADSDVPESVLRGVVAPEIGHGWSKKFRREIPTDLEEIEADDFAARATCGHCTVLAVRTYHDFNSPRGATFAAESRTHLALEHRVKRISDEFGDPGFCTCL
jgi:hypothetical protein